jgi:hypothetical protein
MLSIEIEGVINGDIPHLLQNRPKTTATDNTDEIRFTIRVIRGL